jgi:hypothetical protein
MSTRVLPSRLLACAVWLGWGTLPARASAAPEPEDVLERCASAAERGQAARVSGKLRRARDEFKVCSAPACPAVVLRDCARWLAELDAELPHLVLRARDVRDRDVIGVRVYANGELVTRALDGRPIALDPGRYLLRYEVQSGAVAEQDVVLHLGDQQRMVSLRFDRALERDGSAAPLPAPAKPPARRPQRVESAEPTWGYVFGAGALASFAGFAFFELRGQDRYRELDGGCGRTRSCAEEDVERVRGDFIAAGSFLAVSVVCIGISTWQFLSSGRALPSAPPTAGAAPRGLGLHF